MFDVESVKRDVVQWVSDWFEKNGKGCNAVIGISGGKDSSVTAAVCAAALGAERVIGVLMPRGVQHDIDVARRVCALLGIRSVEINIAGMYDALTEQIEAAGIELSEQAQINISPRLRMTAVYAVSQSNNGRVANTCNLSEDWVGYSTRWGDAAGDFSPLSNLTVDEVKKLGRSLGLPDDMVEKPPIDGLCGKTDEDNLGFTYAVLDKYIRTGVCDDPNIKANIDRRHAASRFKLKMFESFPYAP